MNEQYPLEWLLEYHRQVVEGEDKYESEYSPHDIRGCRTNEGLSNEQIENVGNNGKRKHGESINPQ